MNGRCSCCYYFMEHDSVDSGIMFHLSDSMFKAGYTRCQPIWHISFSRTGKLFWHLPVLPKGHCPPRVQPNRGVTLHASQRVHPGAALQLCWQHRNFPSTKNPLWYLISRWGLPLISGEQAGRKHSMSKC